MRFSSDAVQLFADWSADRNPLHVDERFARQTYFGRTIVHGALTALEALRHVHVATPDPVKRLDIEFRTAAAAGEQYEASREVDGRDLVVTLNAGGQLVLAIRAEMGPLETEPNGRPSWASRRPPAQLRQAPAEHQIGKFEQGIDITGVYPLQVESGFTGTGTGLSDAQARVLGLCSYITGMELPGLKSLFTRIAVQFHAEPDGVSELWYRARTTRFDTNFRILDTHLEVVTPSGVVIATAVLTSYVPFSPAAPDVGHLATAVHAYRESLQDKVALVLGGSRGLGADIAAGLALAGCRVYAAARQDISQDQPWLEELRTRGAQVKFLQGDVGDPAWCESTLNLLRERHGRIDALVLNACAPPGLLRFGSESAVRHAAYVRENLRLVETPLAAFAGALETSGGAVVCISSSFVQDPPAGFGHYVAVKQAAEALVRTVCRERPRLSGLIARPPVLQTRWNDTPAAVVGAIPAQQAALHIVKALGMANAGTAVVLSEFPPAEPAAASEPAPAAAAFSIRLAATFTVDALVPAMRFWADEFDAGAGVETAPYGQVMQSLLDPASVFNAAGRGVNLLFLRVRDWVRELAGAQADDIDFVRSYLQNTVGEFERALRAHRAQAASETLLIVCPSYGTLSSAESILLRQAEADVVAGAFGLPGLHVVSASEHHAQYRVDEDDVHDELRDDIAHIPYREEYLCVLATIAARQVHRQLTPPRKVVVVDCDNTLWRGVVGEVGAEGVEFDEGHRALHMLLVRLANNGVLVCLCSKNDEADVWRVFDTRADLLVPREHVVAAAINWLPKSQNIRTLAARLNLGLDSFVFIDDNPVECAEVQAGCPEVLTLCWPQEPDRAERLAQHVWELDPRKTTKEDARRTELYREEFRRQQARAETLTFADFIDSLQLVVDIEPLASEDLRRAAQLTLRTNQFNFTTIRREEADVQALTSTGRHDIRTIRVRDRFGDYGLVGLVIVERGDDWTLDTFLLSCRVLGRGVEHRIMADLGQRAAAAGARCVELRLETTKRNTPARAFLDSIVPAQFKLVDSQAVDCSVPATVLADVRFEPTTTAEAPVQDEGGSRDTAYPLDTNRLRRRERQVLRTAFDLATGADLRTAIQRLPEESGTGEAPADEDIAAIVHAAFARALRISADRVAAVDNLEALGCDSLRIVETTVALREKFAWIPATLLFEHRSVSAIVREISRRSVPALPQAVPAAATRVASARHEPESSPPSNDVAVVGMHVRCAGVNSPDELWDLLSAGRSSVRPVPIDRHRFLQPLSDSRPHWAGLLDEPAQFDAAFFGVSPREAEFMDPQLRLFLEVAWGALEDAGCAGDHDEDTGVFAGVMYGDYGFRANLATPGVSNPYRCWEGFSLANRLSQLLGFHGPSLSVDTACSSSGTALHLACAALKAGDCSIAVVGGVNLILDPDRFASLGRLGILSNRGRCEPFGADADGTVLGEGAGVVVLRPLDDALRRGDRIYGVIKGTGISTGSGTVGFTAPNPQAQAAAIRRALKSARVDPRTVTYVETHGTGTALGDPIEVRGLALGYGSPELHDPEVSLTHRATIGSIKPNIGHLEAGAGVFGLIKVLLQLSRRTILPSMTSAKPNPQIPFADVPFDVQRTLADWTPPVMRLNGSTVVVPRRAGLSSFGVGGANAHVIVEEAPSAARPSSRVDRPIHVLALSATTDAALNEQALTAQNYLERNPDVSAGDFCYSINTGRKHLERRVAVTAPNRNELRQALSEIAAGGSPRGSVRGASGKPPKVAFLFTGQGSQYAGMGRQLYESQPVFRAALDRCAALFDTLLNRSLLDLLFADEGTAAADLLNQTGYTQPALFAVEYAVSEMWQAWGIRPDVVLGHSVGEIAAMCVAGGVSLDDGLRLIAARGRLMQALPAGGVMTSVMADERRVLEAIAGAEDLVAIAAINTPGQVVISGAGTAVAEIAARLTADGIKTKPLVVSHAFHSPLMKPMLAEYERVVRNIRFSPPRVPFVSGVDGVLAGNEITRTEYWLRNVIEPVRFAAGAMTLESEQVSAFVEVGPHPVLLAMTRQCISDEGVAWLPSLRKDADAWPTVAGTVAELYARGADLDWKAFDHPYDRKRVSVPTYSFSRKEYWIKNAPTVMTGTAIASSDDRHGHPAAALYELAWRKVPSGTVASNRHQDLRHWIVIADRGGIGNELARLLTDRSAGVTVVAATDASAASPWKRDASEPRATCIVDLRGLDLASLNADLQRGAWDAVELTQTVVRTAEDGVKLWLVTRNAVTPSTATGVALAAAPLWGLGRTIALEYPEHWGGLIDVAFDTPAAAAHALAEELLSGDNEDQVSLSLEGRHVARLVRNSVRSGQESSPPLTLSGDGAYLVTGGTGALGLHVARWLVTNGARRLVLASRSGVISDRARATVAELEKLGASVVVVSADVSRPGDVDRLISDITAASPLKGIVHAAGVDSVVPLSAMTASDVSAALDGKAIGAWLLHERTRSLKLDLFVCFSSMSSVLGAQGRAHYSAANAFLDALVAERRRLGLAGNSINWGPWSGGGMASAEELRQFSQIGNRALTPDAAVRVLRSIVAGAKSQTMVADIDWETFRPVYEARRPRLILAELDELEAGGPEPAVAPAAAPWLVTLQSVTPAERVSQLTVLLRREVADTLGFDGPESVPLEKSFYDLGMDSLMMADLVGRLKNRVGVSCTGLVFDHPNVRALADRMLERLPIDERTAGAVPVPAPAATVSEDRATGLDAAAEAEILAFQPLAFPDRRADWVEPRWRWMFVDSAVRLGVMPRVWMHRDNGAIVGQMGSIPVRVKIGDEHVNTGWLVDTMVMEDYRQQAVGSRLMVEAQDDQPFSLSLGQSAEMREIQFRLGWKQVAPLQIAQLLVRPANVLKGKVPAVAAWAADLGLRASSAFRARGEASTGVATTVLDRFDRRHDLLWETVAPQVTCAVVRDASYLNWKYVSQPGQEFLRLHFSDGSGLKGVVVWMMREPDANYRYRRAFLVDVIAPFADPVALQQIITGACAAAADRGADALLCHHLNGRLTQALRACGFHLRKPERFFLVSPGDLSGASLDRVLTADNWLITYGDSDIDRPW